MSTYKKVRSPTTTGSSFDTFTPPYLKKSNKTLKPKIHPVIIFPFEWLPDSNDVKLLYKNLVSELCKDTENYFRPLTIMDYKTYTNVRYKQPQNIQRDFENFIGNFVVNYSDLQRSWCVDTCQMWNVGLGEAFLVGGPTDIYWLIPGDFFYSRNTDVLEQLYELPESIRKNGQDFCLGEITVDPNSSKQLIDTYGTYGLLYNWFPSQAKTIRQKTDKPRSEFFAISGSFLEEVLRQRWYAYEQTIVILLQGVMSKKNIQKVELGEITDLSTGRDSLASAMQQVERTERVLKMLWRDKNEQLQNWIEDFKKLDQQSSQVRATAMLILQNQLS